MASSIWRVFLLSSSIWWLLVLSLLPGFEGRYVVLVAPLFGFSVWEGFAVAVIGVLALSMVLGFSIGFLDDVARVMLSCRYGLLRWIADLYIRYLGRVRDKAEGFVERYGVIGLSLFVAIPLPLTGVWTGAFAGYVLGFPRRKLIFSLIVGGILSNLVTLLLAFMGVYVLSR